MADVANNFITQFHNLPGETIKEKHQNLFHLLQQHRTLKNNSQELASIATNLKPTNHFAKILRTDFLIYFNIFDSLYKDFIKGEEITVKKLSKQDWFFQQAFKEVNYEDFTNNILPAVSYSLKLKILKKLPVEEKNADEFFDAVRKRYGIFLATVLLPKCSSSKINDTLKHYPVKLTVAQLKRIFNKNPELIYVYMEERVKIEGTSSFMNNNPIFIYIAQKNPEMFANLFHKYSFDTKLGRRTTKGFIDSQKSTVTHNNESYVGILNHGMMIRKIGYNIKNILFKKSGNGGEVYWKSLIQHYPKHQQFDIFKSMYDHVYRHKFGEDINAISEEMLKIIPIPEDREKLALLKMEEESKDDYLKYVTSNYCLKELMDKINHLTASERTKYVELTTACCCLNKDMSSLLKLCELVCVRFKNDDASIQRSFLSELSLEKSVLDLLDEKHWKYITEIVATQKAKHRFYDEHTFMLKYIQFLIKNNKSIKEVVEKSSSCFEMFGYSDTKIDSKSFKIILRELIEVGHVKPNDDQSAAAKFDCELAYYCKIYNDKNPDDVISVLNNPRIIKSVKQMLEDNVDKHYHEHVLEGIQYMVCRPNSSEEMLELKKLYFRSLKAFGQIGGLMWFLKHEPKTLEEYFDQFLNVFFDTWGFNTTKLWKIVKKYTYLDLDRRTVEFCKQKLADQEFLEKKHLIRPLTILSSPGSHVEFLKAYVPTSEKVDLTDDDIKCLYTLQGKLVILLHYLNSPKEVINAAFDFCKGDYLQFALTPLYSSIYKLPESEAGQFINKLDQINALSVRKHATNLSCVIHDVDTVYNSLKNAIVPFPPSIKYFSKNPSEALWKLIETQIGALGKNEIQRLKLPLTKVDIPFEYKGRYIEVIWDILDKHENKELKKLLFPKINTTSIKNLNSEFAFKIIRNSIFKMEEAHDLVAEILVHLNDDAKFAVLSEILSNFKRNCWNHPKMRKTARRKLNLFILNLFGKYMHAEESDTRFVTQLETLFSSIFTLSEAFEESVAIKFMNFKGENLENHCKHLIQLNNLYCKEYGPFAVNLFADSLNNYIFKYIYPNKNEKFELCHSLLQFKVSINDYLLILKLLPSNEPEEQEYFKLFNSVILELRQVTDNVIQLQFNKYLKSGPFKNTILDWDVPRLCSGIC